MINFVKKNVLTSCRSPTSLFYKHTYLPPRPASLFVQPQRYLTSSLVVGERQPRHAPPSPTLLDHVKEASALAHERSEWSYERVTKTAVKYTVVDENGKISTVSHSLSRRDFLAEFHLHPRDLRNMDNPRTVMTPAIMIRQDAILVNLLELRVIVQHDKVIVLEYTDDSIVTRRLGAFIYDLQERLSNKSSEFHAVLGFESTQPFEFRALESILMTTVAALDRELGSDLEKLKTILVDLEDHVDRDLLKELLVRSKALSAFYQKTSLIRKLIDDTLDNDEDLVAMYLSEKFQGKSRDLSDHSEAELLLESYYSQVNEIVKQVEQVLSNIKSTEEIINIMLDSNRNSLMLYELRVTIATLGMTVGMFFAGLFGMNLKNFIEESTLGFGGVSGVIMILAGLVYVLNLRHLARIKHVAMMEGHRTSPRHKLLRPIFAAKRRHLPQDRKMMWKWLVEERNL